MEFFSPTKHRSNFILKNLFTLIIIILFFLLIFNIYFFSLIKSVAIKSNLSDTANQKIITNFNQIKNNKNLYSIPTSFKLSEPFFTGEILIQKSYLHRSITLVPEAKDPIGVLCETEVDTKICFWFDENNILFKEAPAPSGKKVFIINEPGIGNHSLNEKLMPSYLFTNLIKIFNYPNIASLISNKFDLDLKNSELTTINNEDLEIKLSLRFDPTTNLKALEKSAPDAQEYIDLRVENRIYYK